VSPDDIKAMLLMQPLVENTQLLQREINLLAAPKAMHEQARFELFRFSFARIQLRRQNNDMNFVAESCQCTRNASSAGCQTANLRSVLLDDEK